MSYLIIADWDADFHPTRINDKPTEAEATTLVDKLINDMPLGKEAPNAFYVVDPRVSVEYIVVDPVTKTISVDTAQQTVDQVNTAALTEIARLEGQVTQRRLREAALGTDAGWLANQDTLIAAERVKILQRRR